MGILDIVKKKKPMEKVSDLVTHFVTELEKTVEDYSEVRLIFQHFDVKHVTDYNTKIANPKRVVVHYHINNNTPIKNVENF